MCDAEMKPVIAVWQSPSATDLWCMSLYKDKPMWNSKRRKQEALTLKIITANSQKEAIIYAHKWYGITITKEQTYE